MQFTHRGGIHVFCVNQSKRLNVNHEDSQQCETTQNIERGNSLSLTDGFILVGQQNVFTFKVD